MRFFSIIVPTYNRPHQLEECLLALSRLEYPRDLFEVIVVDDGSEVSPGKSVHSVSGRLQVSLIEQQNSGPAAARNRGAAAARGEILAFTDDDCTPAADWLSKLAERFEAHGDCAVGGSTLNQLTESSCAAASQLLVDYLYEYCRRQGRPWRFFTSNNFAVAAERFAELGGFDDSRFKRAAGEDRDFCERWMEHGYALVHAPEARVYHAHNLGLKTFCRQHFNYGRGACHLHAARAHRQGEQVRIEPLPFYLGMLRFPYTRPVRRRLWVSALMGLSQVAHAAGYFKERSAIRRAGAAAQGASRPVAQR